MFTRISNDGETAAPVDADTAGRRRSAPGNRQRMNPRSWRHHQLRLELAHGVDRHADDDQQRSGARSRRVSTPVIREAMNGRIATTRGRTAPDDGDARQHALQ